VDLVTSGTVVAAAVAISAFMTKLIFNGHYVSVREFDGFREEIRGRFQDVRDDIGALSDRL